LNKRWMFLFLKVAIAVATLIILMKMVDFSEIRSALRNPLDPFFIFLAGALLIPNVIIQLYRWYFLLRLIKPDIKFIEVMGSLFGGMVVGFITPGRLGELGRSLFIQKSDRLQIVGLVFIDKMYSFVMVLSGGIWSFIFILLSRFDKAPFIVLPLCIVGVLVCITSLLLILHPHWIRTGLYNLSLILPYRDKLKRLISSLDQFTSSHAWTFMILSFLLYAIYILQFCFLARSFEIVPWKNVLGATTATIFAKTLLPVSLTLSISGITPRVRRSLPV